MILLKKIIHIVLNTYKTISHQKINSILIFLVLIVSFTCSLFTLAMGNAETRKKEENSFAARTLKFEFLETDFQKIQPLFEKIENLYELKSFVIVGQTVETIETYSSLGMKKTDKTAWSATDFCESIDNFRWHLTMPKVIENGKLFLTGNFDTSILSYPKFLNGKTFLVEKADVEHKYFDDARQSDNMYFLTSSDFYGVATKYSQICIMFKDKPDSIATDNVLNIICNNVEPTNIIMPEKPKGIQVEKNKLFFTIGLLFLSFINIKSAFLFLCSTRKNEYKIYRKYGATKSFIALDVFGMILIFSIYLYMIIIDGIYRLFLRSCMYSCRH